MEDRELRTAAGVRRLDDELRAARLELAELRRAVARVGACLALGLLVAGLVVPLWTTPATVDAATVGAVDAAVAADGGRGVPVRMLSGGLVLLGSAQDGHADAAPSSLHGALGPVGGLMVCALLGVLLLALVVVGVAADGRRFPPAVATAGIVGGALGATCAAMVTIWALAEEPDPGWGAPLLVGGVALSVWLVRTPALRHDPAP